VQNASAMRQSSGKSSQKCTKVSKIISNQTSPLQISLCNVELFKQTPRMLHIKAESQRNFEIGYFHNRICNTCLFVRQDCVGRILVV